LKIEIVISVIVFGMLNGRRIPKKIPIYQFQLFITGKNEIKKYTLALFLMSLAPFIKLFIIST
jgi:hypothetical protein